MIYSVFSLVCFGFVMYTVTNCGCFSILSSVLTNRISFWKNNDRVKKGHPDTYTRSHAGHGNYKEKFGGNIDGNSRKDDVKIIKGDQVFDGEVYEQQQKHMSEKTLIRGSDLLSPGSSRRVQNYHQKHREIQNRASSSSKQQRNLTDAVKKMRSTYMSDNIELDELCEARNVPDPRLTSQKKFYRKNNRNLPSFSPGDMPSHSFGTHDNQSQAEANKLTEAVKRKRNRFMSDTLEFDEMCKSNNSHRYMSKN